MISVANEIAEAGFDPQGRTSEDLLDLAESRFSKSPKAGPTKTKGRRTSPMSSMPLSPVSNSCSSSPMTASPGSIPATTTSTKKTAGLQPSDLIIVAARPSMGKTTFAMNLVENAAMLQDKPVLIFSLEMPSEQIMMRSLASLSRASIRPAFVPVNWTTKTGRGSPAPWASCWKSAISISMTPPA